MSLIPLKGLAQERTPKTCNPDKLALCDKALKDADYALRKLFEAIQLLVMDKDVVDTENEELMKALVRLKAESDKQTDRQVFLVGGGVAVGIIIGILAAGSK
jgi:hypothetical protein